MSAAFLLCDPNRGHGQTEDRAAAIGPVLCPQAAAMGFDNRACNRQSRAHAAFLGRKKWLENSFQSVRRDTGPVSETESSAVWASVRSVRTVIRRLSSRPVARASMALTIKLRMTCSNWIR